MRDFHLQKQPMDQIPSSCRSKSNSKPNKLGCSSNTRKNLNQFSKAVSEEDSSVFKFPEEGIDLISEISDHSSVGESAENFIVNPVATPSSKTKPVNLSDFTVLSSPPTSAITSNKDTADNASKNEYENPEVVSVKKIGSIEMDMLIKHLKDARVQVLNSTDVNHSKKLLDSLINLVIEEFYGGLYEEKDWLDKLLSRKAGMFFLSILIGILAVSVFLFFSFGGRGLHGGPMPT